jgi:hypothetical protein|tara:strand:- start:340 stop:1155 length:816 start_codon:yes stop_codon:yes gene_type:complete
MNKTNSYIEKCTDTTLFLDDEKDHKHYILYHPCSLQNYGYALLNLKEKSPSFLKYSRKTIIPYNQQMLPFQTSDVHLEIDFELLGVNEYSIFFELFRHIKENMLANVSSRFYILCLHFQEAKRELLDVFYTFLNEPKIAFLFCCTQISFLHPNMLKRCVIKKHKNPMSDLSFHTRYQERMDVIAHEIMENKFSFFQWREKLYELLVLNYNIHDCFGYLIKVLIQKEHIHDGNIDAFFKKYFDIMMKFNNNYRTIYHLEHFIVYLININKSS